MANAQYQVEIWKRGALVNRSEVSDCVEKTLRNARTLYDALGPTFTVFIVRDGVNFCEYEWHGLEGK